MGILDRTESSINIGDAEAPSFDPLPAGWYTSNITNVDTRTTSENSQKYPNVPMLNVEYTIAEGDYEGRKVWRNYLIHDDFAGFLKQLLAATGVWSEDDLESDDFDFEPEELEGSELNVKLNKKRARSGPNEGDMENNVVEVKPAGSTESMLP